MRVRAVRFVVAGLACVVAFSCGAVPTLADGIAFISPIVLPSPAVAAGDQLRDSLGNVAPLQVLAYDRNNALIPGVTASYLVTSIPAGVSIDSSGRVTAFDSVRTVTIVARIGDRLQTTSANLEVVAQPDSITAGALVDSLVSFADSGPLQVKVSGSRNGTRVPVKGIIVHYMITKLDGLPFQDTTSHELIDKSSNRLRSDPRLAVDTTDASGLSSRVLRTVSLTGHDSIVVEARANSLKGVPLNGSPIRFVLPVKKGQ